MTATAPASGLAGSAPPAHDGRIPFTFRIGVTGHRRLTDPAGLVPSVHEAVRGLAERLLGTTDALPPLLVLSSLAEGADRLVAAEVLTRPGAKLEAVLPRAPGEYLEDFADRGSKAEFTDLLSRADSVWQAPPAESPEEAYERAGHYVVDHSDAVVALWDGEPARGRGGTATVVQYAGAQGVPLAWVRTTGARRTVYRLGDRVRSIRQAADEFRQYNAPEIKDFPLAVEAERQRLEPGANDLPDPAERVRAALAAWILPYFTRADSLASRLQLRFRVMSTAMFLMAAAAVAVVTVQTVFLPRLNWIAVGEMGLLLLLLCVPVVIRRQRVLDRWISYRFLAERLRSGYFLALAGTGDRRAQHGRPTCFFDPSETWIRRALAEITARRPAVRTDLCSVESLRNYLGRYWIDEQIRYYRKAARRQEGWDTRLFLTSSAVFGVTLVAAFFHVLGAGEKTEDPSAWGRLVVALAVCMPAAGAAVHGIRTQAQFRQNSQRYTRMVGVLQVLKSEMDQARSLEQVQQAAVETERAVREENSDWFGVMRFHDIELIS